MMRSFFKIIVVSVLLVVAIGVLAFERSKNLEQPGTVAPFANNPNTVSYTHLTLPTIYSV